MVEDLLALDKEGNIHNCYLCNDVEVVADTFLSKGPYLQVLCFEAG